MSRVVRFRDLQVVRYPSRLVHRVVEDVDRYSQFLPWCSKSHYLGTGSTTQASPKFTSGNDRGSGSAVNNNSGDRGRGTECGGGGGGEVALERTRKAILGVKLGFLTVDYTSTVVTREPEYVAATADEVGIDEKFC